MFFKEFESNLQFDPNVLEISFSEKNDNFSMEILSRDQKEADTLKGDLIALRKGYDVDSPVKQNFNIDWNKETAKVIVSGNIYNAFNILTERKLISSNFASTILGDIEAKNFLSRTKDFILPENKIENQSFPSDEEEEISSLEERYASYLSKLSPVQLEGALKNLCTNLAGKGTKVKIEIQESQLQKSH